MNLPKIYYCKRCDRYTDVRYLMDKVKGERQKSYCYKCEQEIDLIPIVIGDNDKMILDKTGETGKCAICGKEALLIIDICQECATEEYGKVDKMIIKKKIKDYY